MKVLEDTPDLTGTDRRDHLRFESLTDALVRCNVKPLRTNEMTLDALEAAVIAGSRHEAGETDAWHEPDGFHILVRPLPVLARTGELTVVNVQLVKSEEINRDDTEVVTAQAQGPVQKIAFSMPAGSCRTGQVISVTVDLAPPVDA